MEDLYSDLILEILYNKSEETDHKFNVLFSKNPIVTLKELVKEYKTLEGKEIFQDISRIKFIILQKSMYQETLDYFNQNSKEFQSIFGNYFPLVMYSLEENINYYIK